MKLLTVTGLIFVTLSFISFTVNPNLIENSRPPHVYLVKPKIQYLPLLRRVNWTYKALINDKIITVTVLSNWVIDFLQMLSLGTALMFLSARKEYMRVFQ